MSKIKTNKRVAKFMPGFDMETGDLKTYEIQNALIAGKTGSGVETFLNSMVINMIQFVSPSNISLEIYSYYKENIIHWINPDRRMPHFRNQKCTDCIDCIDDVWDRIEDLVQICSDVLSTDEYNIVYEETIDSCANVIILENIGSLLRHNPSLTDYRVNLLKALLMAGPRVGIFVLMTEDEYFEEVVKVIDYIPLRFTTRLDELYSNIFMGCNLSTVEDDKYGFIWVSDVNNRYCKTRLNVKFYPDMFISKMCKLYSTDKKEYKSGILGIYGKGMESVTDLSAEELIIEISALRGKYGSYGCMSKNQLKEEWVEAVIKMIEKKVDE